MAAAVKGSIGELAVLGGAPAFSVPLHVGRPNVGVPDIFLQRARDALDRRWLSNHGPLVVELERRVAAAVGVKHCIAVCNGTVALELVVRAAGLAGEVILPSFTFVATAHALRWHGLTPVFCEVDEQTHNLDPGHVAELITDKTSAIVGVHVWGRPAYSDELVALADEHGLRLIFDAAHAVGCSYQGRPIGSRGDGEIFSFHATKVINSFEGGAVLTNDDDLADRVRRSSDFGFATSDEIVDVGINAKMSEVAAAMGLSTLDQLDDFVAVNRRNYERYRASLAGLPGISLLAYDESERHNYHSVVLEVDREECPVARDDLVRILHAENILARRYFDPPCHRLEPYRSLVPDLRLPVTDRVSARVISLPTGTAVGEHEVKAVGEIVRLAVENAHLLPEGLPEFKRAQPPALD